MVFRWLVIIFGILILGYAAINYLLPYFSPRSVTIGGPVAVLKQDIPKHGLIGINFELQNERSNLIISEVLSGSGAESAGLKRGDIVLEINDTAVNTKFEAREALKSTKPNQIINAKILRDSQSLVLKVRLMSAKELIHLRKKSQQTKERDP